MEQYLVAFLTGLTTGGLSCLAVQGGLLASSLEKQIEKGVLSTQVTKNKRKIRANADRVRSRMIIPILLFLVAKISAYTLLGLLLGAVGSVLQLNPFSRAMLLIFIGFFMVGNGLRMLNVHPIFRYFVIEPPKTLTRFIRRTSNNDDFFTPIFLGALTVFIPCGVTQAMMAVAMGTRDPWQAAGLMFAFTLGTSPVFFIVSYLATELGSRLESIFMRLVAVIVLLLGLVSVDSGLTLMGAPSIMKWAQNFMEAAPTNQEVNNIGITNGTLFLNATNEGYSPRILHAKVNTPLKLNLVTNQTYSCARGFVIPSISVEELLPSSGSVLIDIPAQKRGTVMGFTCSMGMYTGEIIFDIE